MSGNSAEHAQAGTEAGMFSGPWNQAAALEASRAYYAAAVLVVGRDFLAVPDLAYWKSFIASHLRSAPGLVGHSVHGDAGGKRWCLVTLWADRPSRDSFCLGVVRKGMLEDLEPQVAEGRCAEWEATGAEGPPPLGEALRRVAGG